MKPVTRRTIRQACECVIAPISEALAAERQALALLAATATATKGIAAFLEKRTPDRPAFSGRLRI